MIELVAQKVVSLLSNDDWVHITGKKGILFNGAGSYCRLEKSGIEFGTDGTFAVHSATASFAGPKNATTASRTWPESRFNDRYIVKDPRTDLPIANMRYRLTHEDGSVVEGLTDSQGMIPLQRSLDPSSLRISLLGIAAPPAGSAPGASSK